MVHTEKLFYDYASSKPLETGIAEMRTLADGSACVLLEKTVFYPEGGGQPCDRGTINGIPILAVLEKDGEIYHLVPSEDSSRLKPGKAELILDTRRRRDLMQLHSGQHLFSGLLYNITGAKTVSMHLGDETCTIDVDAAEIKENLLLAVEDAIADAIEENHPVITHLCPPEDISSFPLRKMPPKGDDVIRVVDIGDYDMVACCGTHVKSTAEIGLFRILGAEKYKGMTRISFLAGRRLLLDSRLLRQNAVIASRALSVPLGETGKGVLDLAEKLAQAEKRIKAFEETAIREKAEALLRKTAGLVHGDPCSSAPPVVVESYDDEDINSVLNIGKIAQKRCKAILILVSKSDLKFAAYSSVEDFDLRPFLKDSLNAQGGKGGGSSTFFQGSFSTSEALGAFLRCFTGR